MVTVCIAVFPTMDVLVTEVVTNEVLVVIVLVVIVVSANVTWKLTGRSGMVKAQVSPG